MSTVERLSWGRFGHLVLDLAEKIHLDFRVDVIVGIGKSGFIPAAILAKKLGVDGCYTVSVAFYGEGKPPARLFEKPRILYSNVGDLRDKSVLVVDDFAHTGSTLREVTRIVKERGAREVRSAVVALREDAEIEPDYYALMFKGCVVFPWDSKTR